jgi:hypothetical protein
MGKPWNWKQELSATWEKALLHRTNHPQAPERTLQALQGLQALQAGLASFKFT